MSFKRKYSLFVSSTYGDLKSERQAVMDVALENDFIPVGMEQFHAFPASQWDIITKMIDECDCYLLIIGGKYGSIDESVGISYTEKEYGYAKTKGLPVLVLIKELSSITQDKIDVGEGHLEKQRLLELFRTHVKNDGNTVDWFSTIEDIRYKASIALNNARNCCSKYAGWTRYSDVQAIVNEHVEEANRTNAKLADQQESRLQNIEKMLQQMGVEFNEVKKNQLEWKKIKVVTKEDIDNMFAVENGKLDIKLPK